MSNEPLSTDGPAPLPIERPKRRGPMLSPVWLIPVFAIAAALWVAWQDYAARGPLIQVAFGQANGVRAGETELHYRDIRVGVVEEVGFSADLGQVVTTIRVDKTVAPYIDEDAVFWIVSPKVTTQGITGLETVLSGVYINGIWDDQIGTPQSRFTGTQAAPLLEVGETGISFVLRSETGLPPEGTPILYRGVEVGVIGPPDIVESGLYVQAPAVVRDPYAALVSSTTRFWDVSGFEFTLDASGAAIDFSSVATLLAGGVTFDTLGSGGIGVAEDTIFTLYSTEDQARDQFFSEADGGTVDLQMVFDENLPGLQPGAEVRLGGIRLGEVLAISGVVDAERFGDSSARLLATVRLNSGRLGIASADGPESFLEYLDLRVSEGLRARLTNASILTGGLMIELVQMGGAVATLNREATPHPVFPTVPARVTNLTATAQGLLARVDALPVEELFNVAITTLEDVRQIVGSEALRAAPDSLLATLEAARGVVASEDLAALPAQLASLTAELGRAATGVNALIEDVQQRAIIADVQGVVSALGDATGRLPGLAEQAGRVLSQAEAVSLDALAADARALLSSIDALVAQPEAKALPGELNAALSSLRDTLDALRSGGLVDNANATLAAARDAAEAVAQASKSLPALSRDLSVAARQANVTLSDFGRTSEFGRELSGVLRQIEAAAAAVDRLARQIARNPSSLLTGR